MCVLGILLPNFIQKSLVVTHNIGLRNICVMFAKCAMYFGYYKLWKSWFYKQEKKKVNTCSFKYKKKINLKKNVIKEFM